jgi:hypothetical protein
VRLAIGAVTALVLAAVLVAPLVILGTGSKHGTTCAQRILFRRQHYTARPTTRVVEAIAVGVGVASGCGQKPSNVNLRSVAGIKPALAVALASDPTTVYVRVGVCPHAKNAIRCLRSRAGVVATGSLPQ